ncbi:Adenosine monophosphate-protein transferase and cysteine protease ibpA [Quillaja saponaria]|uniref:Adenosine monophosphate-protein transferase and cysteine protease ibpA n=1 Tax=Quillaja saponaria TaxID=32244 RepID=A0AAD7KSB0_QUISA|nr:Adenosine monophosphate-protein transferase and cysteine protease ibpA [Quillaja saponaria]
MEEEVIAKLKDDGDFDKLRLKIIRKLKDNEELRGNIISVVKQSAVLNRAGAENMKPRQLSDAIYGEVGDKVMSQVSDGLWKIIRSSDGMKGEITETVQSVYNKLVYPKGKDEGESSGQGVMPIWRQGENSVSMTVVSAEVEDTLNDSEPAEPPGFTILHGHLNGKLEDQQKDEIQVLVVHEKGSIEERKDECQQSENTLDSGDVSGGAPPGFSANIEHNKLSDVSDEDPDVPPGFG